MQRITRLYIKTYCVYLQYMVTVVKTKNKTECTVLANDRCVCVGVCEFSDHLLTILVHGMRLRLLLANISERAHNGYAVGQFLVVLVVVLFEQGLTDLLPSILTYRARRLVLIQHHV